MKTEKLETLTRLGDNQISKRFELEQVLARRGR